VKEVIVATNFTNEGEATAHYIGEMLKGLELRITASRGAFQSAVSSNTSTRERLAQAVVERRPV